MQSIGGIVNRTAEDTDGKNAGVDARHRRELAELLMPALFALLAQLPADPHTVSFDLEAQGSAAEGWRTAASAMTPTLPPSADQASAPGVDHAQGASPMNERVIARIDGGELGPIRLTIEKTAAGVTVELAAANPATAAQAELERNTLEQSLRATGLNIASITVINDGGGIVLAQTDSDQRLNVLDTTGDSAPEEGPLKTKRPNKRINLTG
jgi:hypothetical protein